MGTEIFFFCTGVSLMLSSKELSALLGILDDQGKQFDTLSNVFSRQYAKKEHFRMACSLYLFLQNGVLSVGARLVAYFLLVDLYKNEPLYENPFLPILIAPLRATNPSNATSSIELPFLHLLLSGPSKEFARSSPNDFINSPNPRVTEIPRETILNWIREHSNRQPPITSAFTKVGIVPPVIDDVEQIQLFDDNSQPIDQESARRDVLQTLLTTDGFEPHYLCPPPPLLSPSVSELIWLNPEEEHILLWDRRLIDPCLSSTKAKDLMNLAFKETLPKESLERLKQSLQRDPQIATQVLTPTKLPDLIERNHTLVVEVLVPLLSSPQIGQYFSVLSDMTTQQYMHSMEVVTALSSRGALPTEFVNNYICNCIQYCQKSSDKMTHSKNVRLLCIFLTALIRNNMIDLKEMRDTL